MIIYKKIKILLDNNCYYTENLKEYIDKEIKIKIGKFEEKEYIDILKYFIDYALNENPQILDLQTISYYSWLLQFIDNKQGYYDLYEVTEDGEGFREGCDTAILIIGKQSKVCLKYKEITNFPNFGQNIVISKGVYEGKDIEGIRYESPKHMCGWWLITDDYDDNVNSLMNVNYYKIAFKRPDILEYLALPFGYRFFMESEKVTVSKDI